MIVDRWQAEPCVNAVASEVAILPCADVSRVARFRLPAAVRAQRQHRLSSAPDGELRHDQRCMGHVEHVRNRWIHSAEASPAGRQPQPDDILDPAGFEQACHVVRSDEGALREVRDGRRENVVCGFFAVDPELVEADRPDGDKGGVGSGWVLGEGRGQGEGLAEPGAGGLVEGQR